LSFNLTGYTNSGISFSYVNSLGTLLDIITYFYSIINKVRDIEKNENIKIPMFLVDKSFFISAISPEKELIVDDIINNHDSLKVLHIFPRFSIEKGGDIYFLEEKDKYTEESENKNISNNFFIKELNKYKKKFIYKSNDDKNTFEIKKENMLILFKKDNCVYLARVLGKTLSRGKEIRNKIKIYKIDYPLKTSLKSLFSMNVNIYTTKPNNLENSIELNFRKSEKNNLERLWLHMTINKDSENEILNEILPK
jgi:hypothetical protein